MDDGLHFVGVLDAGTVHAGLMFNCCVFVPGRILLLLFFASPFFLPVIAPLGFCLVLPAPFVGIVGPYFDFLLVLVVGYLLLLLLSVGGHGLLSLLYVDYDGHVASDKYLQSAIRNLKNTISFLILPWFVNQDSY